MSFKLPKSFTRVTPFSKALALSMLIVFPIVGFWLGMRYQESKKTNTIYSNSYFSFQYPSYWNVSERQNGATFVDLINYKGSLDITWGKDLDINDEKWCKVNNTFKFPVEDYSFSDELKGCIKTIGNGNKEYELIKVLDDGTKVIISANGNTFSTNDYLLMHQILSTFKFTN